MSRPTLKAGDRVRFVGTTEQGAWIAIWKGNEPRNVNRGDVGTIYEAPTACLHGALAVKWDRFTVERAGFYCRVMQSTPIDLIDNPSHAGGPRT